MEECPGRRNRTKVGLKGGMTRDSSSLTLSRNRTKVGLKAMASSRARVRGWGRNRTKVGLKGPGPHQPLSTAPPPQSNQGGIEREDY